MLTRPSIDVGERPPTAPETTLKRARRRVLRVLIVVVVVVGSIWWWRQPAPLSTAEGALVGTWTLPMGPPPLPVNAVQQFFEMRADRTLICYGRPVATGVRSSGRRGSWRLEEGVLVWETTPSNATWRYLRSVVGQGPKPGTSVDRMKFLRSTGDTFFVEDTDGSEATFERVPD